MDKKLAFFNDLNPSAKAKSAKSNRILNVILRFLNCHNTGSLVDNTNYFNYNFQTKDKLQISGYLSFFFSVEQINKNKKNSEYIVEFQAEVETEDEDDYEDLTDLDLNSDLMIYYQYFPVDKTKIDLVFYCPPVKDLEVISSSLKGSLKQNEIYNYIYDLIVNNIWTDSDVFKKIYRNNILYIVFLYISKHVDFTFNKSYEHFINWLTLHEINWCENDNDSQNLTTNELYCELISYSLFLSYHIIKILLGSKLSSYSISPSENLVYFFDDRTDLRSKQNSRSEPNNSYSEDEESFSDEFTQDGTPVIENKFVPAPTQNAYALIGSDEEDTEKVKVIKPIIEVDFNYEIRKKELYELNKELNDELNDVPTMSLNQAWSLIQDKWQFYLRSFTSRYFIMTDFVKSAISNQLKSLKSTIFANWFEIKSGHGQRLFIDVISYETFKIEFLTYESKEIKNFMKSHLKSKISFEILSPQAKYLKNLGIFNDTYEKHIIDKLKNEELALKANGILDGITKDLLNSINSQLSSDIYLVNYFSKIDRELEPPNYQILDSILRISILNLLKITPDVSVSDVKAQLKCLTDPNVDTSTFDGFDKKQYQNQIIKEISSNFRTRIDPAKLLNFSNCE